MYFFQLDMTQADWLRQSKLDPFKENIILIHGYAGGDNTLPTAVLRDGKYRKIYIFEGQFN